MSVLLDLMRVCGFDYSAKFGTLPCHFWHYSPPVILKIKEIGYETYSYYGVRDYSK